MTGKTSQGWARRRGESAKAFAAARIYIELGSQRSLSKTAQVLQRSPHHTRLLKRWSARFQWVKRAAAYDDGLYRIEQQAREAAVRMLAQRWAEREAARREDHYQLADRLSRKAQAMLDFPLAIQETKDGKTVIHPVNWTFMDAARMAQIGFDLQGRAIRNDDAQYTRRKKDSW
jgi:hypothetical protein